MRGVQGVSYDRGWIVNYIVFDEPEGLGRVNTMFCGSRLQNGNRVDFGIAFHRDMSIFCVF